MDDLKHLHPVCDEIASFLNSSNFERNRKLEAVFWRLQKEEK